MIKSDLAQQLRARLLDRELVSAENLDAVSDEEVIESYNLCSGCGINFYSDVELDAIIISAESVEEFLDKIDAAIEEHEEDDPEEIERLREKFGAQLPQYIITPRIYFTEETKDGADPDRFTIIVVRTSDDERVKEVDYIRSVEDSFSEKFEEALSQILDEFEEVDCVSVEASLLIPCACDSCDGFVSEYVCTNNYLYQLAGEEEDEAPEIST